MALQEIATQKIQVSSTKKLIVTISWCKSCGICMEICPQKVLDADEVTKKVVLLAPAKCNGCGLCEIICPDYVFTVEELEAILK